MAMEAASRISEPDSFNLVIHNFSHARLFNLCAWFKFTRCTPINGLMDRVETRDDRENPNVVYGSTVRHEVEARFDSFQTF